MRTTPNIADVLDSFFGDVSVTKTECTRARYARAHAALVRYLGEADLASLLGRETAQIVAAEREFDPTHAFIRVMTAEELIMMLPGFVDGEALPAGRADARTHISLTDRLVAHMIRFRLIDERVFAPQIERAREACAAARENLRHDSAPRLFG